MLQEGSLIVKEGPLNADWVVETDNVSAFALSGDRIAVLRGAPST